MHACCLEPDFAQLVDGDETEIGSFGVNISGGQKARISLARAVYSDRAIVVLDDPLSALDSSVASTVFERLVLGLLRSQKKLVFLITHQVQVLFL